MKKGWLIAVLLVFSGIIIAVYALKTAETDHQSGSIRPHSGSTDYKTAEGAFDFDSHYEGADYIIIVYYFIDEGELGEVIVPEISYATYYGYDNELNLTLDELIAYQEAQEFYEEIWNLVKMIIPSSYLQQIAYLEIFTDGIDNFLGAVEEVEGIADTFILSLDLEDMLDKNGEIIYKDLAETIIHELVHIITLSSDQADWVEQEDANPQTYFIFEYDLDTREGSYMNQFFQLFWADIYEEWSDFYYQYGVLYEGDEALADEYEDILSGYLEEFYEKHRDRFVTEYAATSPTEDIAEAFVFFVTGDLGQGSDMRHQKVSFFYSFPELVQLRDQIAANLFEMGVLW